MVINEASLIKFWKFQNLGNGSSWYYFPYFYVCLKFFIYKIIKLNKNILSYSFQTWECLRIHNSSQRILGLIPKNSDFVCLGMGPDSIFNKSSSESDTENLQTHSWKLYT